MIKPVIVLRLAQATDNDSRVFCQLFNSLYQRKVTESYYLWQFFETPFPTVLAMAQTEDGILAGCYAFHIIKSTEESHFIAWALDIMVAPPFQGSGLFRRLANFAASQAIQHEPVALCVMANQRADSAYVNGLGWHRVNVFTTCVRSTSNAAYQPPSGIDFELVNSFPATFCQRVKSGLSLFGNFRSPEYLNWRFLRNPWYRYEPFIITLDLVPIGYLILKIFKDPVTTTSVGDIVDLGFVADAPDLSSHILRFALDHFCASSVPQATIWLQTNTVLDRAGRQIGFVDTELKRYFCCKVLKPTFDRLQNPEEWLINMSDAEIY